MRDGRKKKEEEGEVKRENTYKAVDDWVGRERIEQSVGGPCFGKNGRSLTHKMLPFRFRPFS